MSETIHNLYCLLAQERCIPFLIKEIEKGCSLSDLKMNEEFSNGIKEYVDEVVSTSEWNKNKEFLKILDEINKEVEKMITEKTLVLAGKGAFAAGFGLGVLICGAAVYWYVNKQKENEKEQNKKQSAVDQPSYKLHTLLLVISANRLPENLNKGSIDNGTVNTLISGAAWAYCFADKDHQGIQIMDAADRTQVLINEIDRTTEINIFIRLELLAKSEITIQRNKLNIKEKVDPNSTGQVLEISKLKSSRSVSSFYEI